MPWEEIAAVTFGAMQGKLALTIAARDPERLATRYNGYKATTLRFNQQQFGFAVGIAETLLPTSVTAVLAQVGPCCERRAPQKYL